MFSEGALVNCNGPRAAITAVGAQALLNTLHKSLQNRSKKDFKIVIISFVVNKKLFEN